MFQSGQLRLFRLFGVTVYMSWTWLLLIPLEFFRLEAAQRAGHPDPRTLTTHMLEYLCVFGIVLVHEFGHALACKSVGGRADRIVLWLLGGAAYVQPPQRPGALLWSIAAGPLVNVILVPLTLIPAIIQGVLTWNGVSFDQGFLADLALINILLLVFNMLPIYPLDGGQILMALLWFIVGRSAALIAVAVIGLIGAVGFGVLAVFLGSIWFGLMAFFMGSQSIRGIQMGLRLHAVESVPRHAEAVCPSCGQHPPMGDFWSCACGAKFDTFATRAQCPQCGRVYDKTGCPFCGQLSPLGQWYSTGGFPVEPAVAPPVPAAQAPRMPPPADGPFP